MSKEEENALRDSIGKMMADGLSTITEPFPENHFLFDAIVKSVGKVSKDNIKRKLVLSGFIDHPYGEDKLRCMECIYYLVNRKWCDLPELDLPVEPEWWCRLWKI